jgi:hypothetical protein
MDLPKIFMTYKDAPPCLFFLSVLSKYLFFLGLGAYFASYLQEYALIIMAVAIVGTIPGMIWFIRTLKKK